MAIPAEIYFAKPQNTRLRRLFSDDAVKAIKDADDAAEKRYSEIEQHVEDLRSIKARIRAKKKSVRKIAARLQKVSGIKD